MTTEAAELFREGHEIWLVQVALEPNISRISATKGLRSSVGISE